jgi:hypothetical protein
LSPGWVREVGTSSRTAGEEDVGAMATAQGRDRPAIGGRVDGEGECL